MPSLKLLFACLFSTLLAAHATAATLDNVTMPDTMQYGGRTLVLNGMGLRTLTVFSVRIYVAGLYLTAPSHDGRQILQSPEPKILMLQFLHGGSKEDVEREYRQGERVNCADGGCSPSDEPDFERLIAASPAVAVGDTTTYVFANRGVDVLANGREIIKVNNPDVAKRLLSGFIGDHPPSSGLRRALLGLPAE